MAHNPGLGALVSLPKELRDQVWTYLSLERHFDFVYASHQIHAEAFPIMNRIMYEDVVLQFHIAPTYEYKSWLSIESQFKTKWSLENLEHAKRCGLHKLHYEKMKKIRINIEAPDTGDCGQIICLYKKCVDLAELLGYAKNGLPDLEIHFLDSPVATWIQFASMSSTISYHVPRHFAHGPVTNTEGEEEDFLFDDDEIMLQAFCRLRYAKSSNVFRPANAPTCDSYDKELIALTLSQPFNVDLDSDDLSDQRELDQIFVGLDLVLDVLDGDTANMLRLDRFSSWYTDQCGKESKYEEEYERIIRSAPTSRRVEERRLFCLYERFSGMILLNPRVMAHQGKEAQLLCKMRQTSDLAHSDSMPIAVDPSMTRSEWNQDAWHIAWADGISPFDSREYLRIYDRRFNKFAVQGRLDRFRERLRSWVDGRTEAPQEAISCNDTEALPLNQNAATKIHYMTFRKSLKDEGTTLSKRRGDDTGDSGDGSIMINDFPCDQSGSLH